MTLVLNRAETKIDPVRADMDSLIRVDMAAGMVQGLMGSKINMGAEMKEDPMGSLTTLDLLEDMDIVEVAFLEA